MADKTINQLVEAESILPADLFVLQQASIAKKLPGQVLLNWLTAAADGHGGIRSIEKIGTSALIDTYRITLADTTVFDFAVSNGRGISQIVKTQTSGLVDTYTITYNDSTSSTFTVTNGQKGDKGDSQYVWIKYASQKPTSSSHSFGDIADNWIGIYSGPSAVAPTNWQRYTWFEIKGATGNTGAPATLISSTVEYQASDSGTVIPSGNWTASVPDVAQGRYLWTRSTSTFNTGNPVVTYAVSRMGRDGSGAVSSVAGVAPDDSGNVSLTASDIRAVPSDGGSMFGEFDMHNHHINGLSTPVQDSQAANKLYVDSKRQGFQVTLTSEGWTGNGPYVQTVDVGGVLESDNPHVGLVPNDSVDIALAQEEAWGLVSRGVTGNGSITFTCYEEKPGVALTLQIEVNR